MFYSYQLKLLICIFHTKNIGQPRKERYLFFHALASNTENRVRLEILNNATAWEHNAENAPREFQEIGTRQLPAISQAMDSDGNLFFGLENQSIACWDSQKSYSAGNIRTLVQNNQTLQFISGLKVKS